MFLRKLELKDAPLMLAWMHDKRVTENLRSNFASKTMEDAENFIRSSWEDKENVHLAIASDEDEYMGTVSLKHIEDGSAELAIMVRYESMGRGYSWFGMESIIEKAFKEYALESVYWCVSRDNTRAVRFYDKHNFNEVLDIPQKVLERYVGVKNLKWYSILKGDEIKRIYYISKVPEGVRRGFHAHKELKQLLFCPYGRIQLLLENKNG